MSKDEIDIMWQKAMQESIKDGEMFTRYNFAKLVAAKEREACIKLVHEGTGEPIQTKTLFILQKERKRIADAIRARGQA